MLKNLTATTYQNLQQVSDSDKMIHFPAIGQEEILWLFILILPLVILLSYYCIFFTAIFKRPKKKENEEEGMSIIICAKNEEENLKKLIPKLLAQNYQNYEVIVINDGSWDGSHQYLEEQALQNNRIKNIYLDPNKKIQSGKKLAITLGVKAAKFNQLLFTDADCLPASNNWIKRMNSSKTDKKDIVLGYSPYLKKKGLLNWFIRLETQLTAFMYLGAAGRGFSYMSVGRNWSYSKEAFFGAKGFAKHQHISAGDDDLQLQEFSKKGYKASINTHPHSFVFSEPKTTWNDWINQKRRHLQIGSHYNFGQKLYAGFFSLAHFWFWIALPVVWVSKPTLLPYLLVILGIKVIITWSLSVVLAKKLRDWKTMILQPFAEFGVMIYWLLMSIYVFFTKKKEW